MSHMLCSISEQLQCYIKLKVQQRMTEYKIQTEDAVSKSLIEFPENLLLL